VSVELLPSPPHPSAPSYLQSLDLEVGFFRKGLEIAEQFSADDMAKVFTRAYNGVLMSDGEVIVFEYHGQRLKATVKGLSLLELPEEQRGVGPGRRSQGLEQTGIVMDKTDISFIKASDSAIKIRSSAKKCVAPPISSIMIQLMLLQSSSECNLSSQL
jgi:vesicle-fusing ATPase